MNHIVDELQNGPASSCAQLAVALGRHASLLARHPRLVGSVMTPLRSRAWVLGEDAAAAAAYCFCQLVSVNSVFLQPVLDTFLRAFTQQIPQSAPLDALDDELSLGPAALPTLPPNHPSTMPKIQKKGPVMPSPILSAVSPALAAAASSPAGSSLLPLSERDPLWPVRMIAVEGVCLALRRVPTGVSAVFAAIMGAFPHKTHSLEAHECFVNALLALTKRVPSIRDRVLALCMEKMVDLDVEIEIPTSVEASAAPAPSTVEAATGVLGGGAEVRSSDEEPPPSHSIVMAGKLDVFLSALLEQLDDWCCAEPGAGGLAPQLMAPLGLHPTPVEGGDTGIMKGGVPITPAVTAIREHLFTVSLAVFERSVLLTQRCKYVQFSLLYMSRLSPNLVDQLIGRLVGHVQHVSAPTVTRCAAAAYVAGFLARAAFVPDTTLRSALWCLLQWVHAYIDQYGMLVSTLAEASGGGAGGLKSAMKRPTPKQHTSEDGSDAESGGNSQGESESEPEETVEPIARNDVVFYASVQCVLYVVVFHAAALREKVGGLDFLRYMQWGRVLGNRLDPLRYCARDVAGEFVRVASLLDLAAEADLARSAVYRSLRPARLDATAASSASKQRRDSDSTSEGGVSQADGGGADANPVSSFFPFDPLLLRNASSFVTLLYRPWHSATLAPLDQHSVSSEGVSAVGGATTDDGAFVSFVSDAEGVVGGGRSRGASRSRGSSMSGVDVSGITGGLNGTHGGIEVGAPPGGGLTRLKRRRSASSVTSGMSQGTGVQSDTEGGAGGVKRRRRGSSGDSSASSDTDSEEGFGLSGGGHLGRSMEQGLSAAMRDALQAGSRGALASRLRSVSFDEETYHAMNKGGSGGLDFGVSAVHRYSMGAGGCAAAAASMGLTDHPSGSAQDGSGGGSAGHGAASDSEDDSDPDDAALAGRFLGFTSSLGRSAHVLAPGQAAGAVPTQVQVLTGLDAVEDSMPSGLPMPAALGGGSGVAVGGAHVPMGAGGAGKSPPKWDVFVQLMHSAADQAAAQSPARGGGASVEGAVKNSAANSTSSGSDSDTDSDSSSGSESSSDTGSDSDSN